jgi:hypothetical protein
VIVRDRLLRNLTLGGLDIGSRKSLTITNLRVPSDSSRITLEIETEEKEIDKNNNIAEIRVAGEG